MEIFFLRKDDFEPLTIFAKMFIIQNIPDVWQTSKCAFALWASKRPAQNQTSMYYRFKDKN